MGPTSRSFGFCAPSLLRVLLTRDRLPGQAPCCCSAGAGQPLAAPCQAQLCFPHRPLYPSPASSPGPASLVPGTWRGKDPRGHHGQVSQISDVLSSLYVHTIYPVTFFSYCQFMFFTLGKSCITTINIKPLITEGKHNET